MKCFLHRCLICGVQHQRQCGMGTNVECLWQKNTRTWSAGLRSQSFAKEAVGIEFTGNAKTRKMEKSCCIAICIIFHAYCMGLHWWSYGTLSVGLESKIIWTIMAIVTVSVSTTWTLCATWVMLSACRIACQLCRILCVCELWESLGACTYFQDILLCPQESACHVILLSVSTHY